MKNPNQRLGGAVEEGTRTMIKKLVVFFAVWVNVGGVSADHVVHATRIGLVGNRTASGHVIKQDSVFVALPSKYVLGKTVRVSYGNKSVICKVKDVGPHSIHDEYWKKGTRPMAEQGKRYPKHWGKPKNPAGIDLSNALWRLLGLPLHRGLVKVRWEFVR